MLIPSIAYRSYAAFRTNRTVLARFDRSSSISTAADQTLMVGDELVGLEVEGGQVSWLPPEAKKKRRGKKTTYFVGLDAAAGRQSVKELLHVIGGPDGAAGTVRWHFRSVGTVFDMGRVRSQAVVDKLMETYPAEHYPEGAVRATSHQHHCRRRRCPCRHHSLHRHRRRCPCRCRLLLCTSSSRCRTCCQRVLLPAAGGLRRT